LEKLEWQRRQNQHANQDNSGMLQHRQGCTCSVQLLEQVSMSFGLTLVVGG
jgi:hypothetical protein